MPLRRKKIFSQFLTYALIGTLTNAAGYLAYLYITSQGVSPKSTVTVLYGIGSLINFLANRRFTFRHEGHLGRTGARYLLAQSGGYLINLLILVLFVDWGGLAHQYVQAVAVIVVAIFLFLSSRFFVFAPGRPGEG